MRPCMQAHAWGMRIAVYVDMDLCVYGCGYVYAHDVCEHGWLRAVCAYTPSQKHARARTHACAHARTQVMLVDETGGLLTGAVVERCLP